LAVLSFESADDLLEAVRGVLEGIEKELLQAVFLEWMDQLRRCIGTSGEYPDETKLMIVEQSSFVRTVLRCSLSGGTLHILG
jgi:hypothetical protein